MESKNNMEDLPSEVVEGICLSMQRYHGIESYRRFMNIVEKYPNYFPQEYAYYFKVPQEIHDSYRKEQKELFDKFYPPKKFAGGIWSQIREVQPYKIEFSELIKEIAESWGKKAKFDYEFERASKKVWDKHYKKYKIDYRK